MARPSSYRTEYAGQAEKLCKLGATDKQIADFFGVSEQTVNNWKQAHPEFLESLRSGKEMADANVAASLYQRAMGYSHEAVKIAASPSGEHIAVPYVERYPPDTTAAIFWLKNRRPDLWRDRHTQEISGPNGGPIETVAKIERVIARPNAPDSDS